MDIFTILILPIHEHGRSFHLLRPSTICFFRCLKFLSYRSFTCLVSHTKVCNICDYCDGCHFLNFFLSLFIIWVEEGYWFGWVNFISSLCWSCLSALEVLWQRFWCLLSIWSHHLQIVILWPLPFQFVYLWSPFVV